MQLVGVPRRRPRLVPDPGDRVRVQPRQVPRLYRQAPRHPDVAAAPVLELAVVEVGERRAVQDLVRED